jgi:hypothetical protein
LKISHFCLMEKELECYLENIPLLLNGEGTRVLFCISFNSDENWDVTIQPFVAKIR